MPEEWKIRNFSRRNLVERHIHLGKQVGALHVERAGEKLDSHLPTMLDEALMSFSV